MLQIKPWLERDLAFDTPRWMFSHVVEMVRGGPPRLEEAFAICQGQNSPNG
jgi:hypothetical protein